MHEAVEVSGVVIWRAKHLTEERKTEEDVLYAFPKRTLTKLSEEMHLLISTPQSTQEVPWYFNVSTSVLFSDCL